MSDAPATNGKGAAAIAALGIGCLALGVFSFSGDAVPAVAALLNVWNPTGPLSGVTSLAILVWLVVWFILSRSWAARDVNFKQVNWTAAAMIIAGLLLTFPPFMDLLQGK